MRADRSSNPVAARSAATSGSIAGGEDLGIELFAHRGDQIVVTERGTGDGRGIAEVTGPADIDSTMAPTASGRYGTDSSPPVARGSTPSR